MDVRPTVTCALRRALLASSFPAAEGMPDGVFGGVPAVLRLDNGFEVLVYVEGSYADTAFPQQALTPEQVEQFRAAKRALVDRLRDRAAVTRSARLRIRPMTESGVPQPVGVLPAEAAAWINQPTGTDQNQSRPTDLGVRDMRSPAGARPQPRGLFDRASRYREDSVNMERPQAPQGPRTNDVDTDERWRTISAGRGSPHHPPAQLPNFHPAHALTPAGVNRLDKFRPVGPTSPGPYLFHTKLRPSSAGNELVKRNTLIL